RGRGLEIVDQPIERFLDAVQLIVENPAVKLSRVVGAALASDHVPDVLVARADDARRIFWKYRLEERAERAGPVRRAMILAEGGQRLQEVRVPLGTWRSEEHTSELQSHL